jgi:hypothetical protein
VSGSRVSVFFYGSYINVNVLAEVDLVPGRVEVAFLDGYDIRIAPLANLALSEGSRVYGILASATHAELDRLYAHARDVLGGVYLPHPVVIEKVAGGREPALCYIATSLGTAPASNDYIDRIAGPARELGFPDEYIERLESFRP